MRSQDTCSPSTSDRSWRISSIDNIKKPLDSVVTTGIRVEDMETKIEPYSTLTCPDCGHAEKEAMPTDACQFFYDCKGCGQVLRPLVGDCCVFCSFGDVPCPPIQAGSKC